MQRTFKYGDIQNGSLTPDQHFDLLNAYLRYHIQVMYTLKMVRFFGHPVECEKK